jgi:hypothetical protein
MLYQRGQLPDTSSNLQEGYVPIGEPERVALVVGNANVGPCNGGNKRYPDFTMCSTVLPAVRETLP